VTTARSVYQRPNLLIAASIADAARTKLRNPEFADWHVMTPRRNAEVGWVYRYYSWTPMARTLPARVRMGLRNRLVPVIDGDSEEKPSPPGCCRRHQQPGHNHH